MSVKRAKLVILAVSILAVPLLMAQVRSLEERTATMSDGEQRGLRGPVKSCTEDSTHPGMADADGKTYPEVHSEYTTEYDTDGRIRITRSRNSDGSQWVTRYGYDASGGLLKTASGAEGTSLTETTYSSDQQGRFQNIIIAMIINLTARLLIVMTSEEGKVRSRSPVRRITLPTSPTPGPRLRLWTEHRTYRAEEARPPSTTNMTVPRKSRCVMPTVSW